ncbi:hypothetical protein, partial [Thiolapillus sp.]
MSRYQICRNIVLIGFAIIMLQGCQTNASKQVLAAGNQVEMRSYQTRTYDDLNKKETMRIVMATLQDLGFVILKADDVAGIISATKFNGYQLRMSVSVRTKGSQIVVRANAQYNLAAVEDPQPYNDFFTSLEKALF